MTVSKSSQNTSGHAFEYAVLVKIADEAERRGANYVVQQNKALAKAKSSFESVDSRIQSEFLIAAESGVRMMSYLEPLLYHQTSELDRLGVLVCEDRLGQRGDVRDLIVSRPAQRWEIGISAKNNHKALKSPRLSNLGSFGKDWLQIECTEQYKMEVVEIFRPVADLCGQMTWKDYGDDNKARIYADLLLAFKEELDRQYAVNGRLVPHNLLQFMLGNADFYKLMRIGNTTQVNPFNIYGGLGKGIGRNRPVAAVRKLPLPDQFLKFEIVSNTTMHVYCNLGWQISLRIHNKDSLISQSLGFDVNLIGHPAELFTLLSPWECQQG